MRKGRAIEALRVQRERTLARLAALDVADWDRDCLPGWQVRDVVAHLVASDQGAVTGTIYRPMRARDRAVIERWNDQAVLAWRDRPPEELLAALERWGRRMVRLATLLPAPLGRIPVGGAYGTQPALFGLYRRAQDEWVHEQDIAWAVGSPGGAGPVTVSPPLAVGQVLAATALAAIRGCVLQDVPRTVGVLRLVVDPAPEGGTISARPLLWGIDFARRQFGERVTAKPDAEVAVGAGVLSLLLVDRLRWTDLDGASLRIDGDEGLAADLLDALPMTGRGTGGESSAAAS